MASLSGVRVGRILAAIGLVGVLGLVYPSAAGAELDEATARKLLAQLKSSDVKERAAAAAALARSKTPAAAERIKGLLADPDPTVRATAIRLLVYPLNDATAVEPIRKLLSDPESRVRAGALLALARLQKKAARDLVLKGLVDKDRSVRWAAGNALREVGPLDASHVPVLLECLAAGPGTPPRVSDTLAALGADVIAPALAYLRDGRFEKRYAGARAIYALMKKSAVPAESLKAAGPGLLALAGSKDPAASGLATRLLATVDPRSHEIYKARQGAGLLSEFNRTALLKRPALMESLGKFGDSRAVAPIAKTLDALLAMKARLVKPDSGRDREEVLIQRSLPGWINTGIEALGHIGGANATAMIRRYYKMGDSTMRAACIRALGQAGDRTAAAELRVVLGKSKSQDETLAAAEALALMGDMQSLERILEIAGAAGQRGYTIRRAFTGFFGPGRSVADVGARGKWRRQMPRIGAASVPLRDAIQFICEVIGANVVVNWRELAPLGIKADDVATLPSEGIPAAYALIVMITKGGGLDKIGFRLVNGTLYVTSTRHLARLPGLDQRAWQAMGNSARTALGKPVGIVAKATPLRTVLEQLASKSGVKIALAEEAKTKARLDPDARIDLVLMKLPLRDALLLAWLQGGATVNLAMSDQNGTLVVGQRASPSTAARPPDGPKTLPADPEAPTPTQRSESEKLAANKIKLADLYRQAGRLDKAKQVYQAIIKDYPNTQTAAIARKHLESMGQ